MGENILIKPIIIILLVINNLKIVVLGTFVKVFQSEIQTYKIKCSRYLTLISGLASTIYDFCIRGEESR